MKKTLSTILIVCFLTTGIFLVQNEAHATTYCFTNDTTASLTTGLVSYWPMEGNSNDFYGSNNGTDSFVAYSTLYGIVGQGADYNGGSSGQIFTGINPTSSFSFVFWTNTTSTSAVQTIMERRVSSNDWGMELNGSNFQWIFFSLSPNSKSSNAAVALGWQFWGVTYDGAHMKVYYDGSLDRSDAVTGNVTTVSPTEVIGLDNEPGGPFNAMSGFIDEVGYWGAPLTAQNMTDLYNSGAGDTMSTSCGGATPRHGRVIIVSYIPVSSKSETMLCLQT